jgi:UPF0755 protein
LVAPAAVRYSIIFLTIVVAAVVTTCGYYYQRINHDALDIDGAGYVFKISPGTSLNKFTRQLAKDRVINYPAMLRWYAYVMGVQASIKAGEYKIKPGTTAAQLLDTVVRGNVTQYAFTIIEGWRAEHLLAALQANTKIKHTLYGLSEQEILQKLAIPETHLEGIFLPDTYYFNADTTDVAFLRRAYNALQVQLKQAWEQRAEHTILQSPYEALILASIIEKESGVYAEYEEISGVFQKRMLKGMRLQADPCVIYGLGTNFAGSLLKTDLRSDSPYNTYTRNGLPPTPIAIPSMRAIQAALHPATSDNMYFVATRDGHHVFSKDLKSHNLAVKQYRE